MDELVAGSLTAKPRSRVGRASAGQTATGQDRPSAARGRRSSTARRSMSQDGGASTRVGGADNRSVRYQFDIANTARECAPVAGNQFSLKVGVSGHLLIGPAGKPGAYTAPLRVIVRDESDKKTAFSKIYKIEADTAAAADSAPFQFVSEPIMLPMTRTELDRGLYAPRRLRQQRRPGGKPRKPRARRHAAAKTAAPIDKAARLRACSDTSVKTPSGRVRRSVALSGAEGATAPETLRPMDRWVMTLWKAAGAFLRPPTDGGNRRASGGKSLRSRDRGGAVERSSRVWRRALDGCASRSVTGVMPMSESATLRTPLHALHVELGARMAPFAGYDMPIQYPTGHSRRTSAHPRQAGLFDVSHMGQARLEGPDHATTAPRARTALPGRHSRLSRRGVSATPIPQRRGRHDRRSDGLAAARRRRAAHPRRQRRAQSGRLRPARSRPARRTCA